MNIDLQSRVQWEEYNGKKYIYLDFKQCSDQQRIAISKIVTRLIGEQNLNSVRLLVDINETTVSVESMRDVKQDWNDVRPHIHKTAIIGIKGVKSILIKVWWSLSDFQTKPCKTKDEALNYICK